MPVRLKTLNIRGEVHFRTSASSGPTVPPPPPPPPPGGGDGGTSPPPPPPPPPVDDGVNYILLQDGSGYVVSEQGNYVQQGADPSTDNGGTVTYG